MEIFTLNLDVNETREVALSGNYFELRNALSPIVLIEMLTREGGVVNMLRGALESDFVQSSLYETVRITNGATAQTIKFWAGMGAGGSRRFSGSVTGTVEMGAPTIAALIAGKYNVRPEASTGRTAVIGAIGANAPEVVFNAAANTNGAILLSAVASDIGAITPTLAFLTKATPPASITDGECMLFAPLIAVGGAAPQYVASGAVYTPQFIPAGRGLFFIASANSYASCYRATRFILL